MAVNYAAQAEVGYPMRILVFYATHLIAKQVLRGGHPQRMKGGEKIDKQRR